MARSEYAANQALAQKTCSAWMKPAPKRVLQKRGLIARLLGL